MRCVDACAMVVWMALLKNELEICLVRASDVYCSVDDRTASEKNLWGGEKDAKRKTPLDRSMAFGSMLCRISAFWTLGFAVVVFALFSYIIFFIFCGRGRARSFGG